MKDTPIFPLAIREEAPIDVVRSDGKLFCGVYPRTIVYPYPAKEYAEACAMARRIVAAMNACRDIPIEALEAGQVVCVTHPKGGAA